MATAGLSFANPLLGKVGVGEQPDPYAPFSPTSGIGAGGLAPSAADMALTGELLTRQSQFTMPEMRKPVGIAFSPTRNELYVQGTTFSADDAAAALRSEALLGGPGVGLPTEGDWAPLDETAYRQYLDSIRNPSLGRLASKSFGRGVDQTQALIGRGLQLAGAEELGGRIVAQQEADLAKTAPYERRFTDIESGNDAIEWFVANLAQQGPNLIESIVTGGLGFLAGAAAGGTPVSAAGGALAGLMGKSAFKEAVLAAARKKAAGEALSGAETKLLREAAGIAGAVATSYAQNLATGAADIYGELREQGADADDVNARLTALAGSLPYAALESLSEFILAGRVFGNVGAPRAMPSASATTRAVPGGTQTVTQAPTMAGRGLELLRRGAVGGAVGGTLEGTTELGQEALVMGLSGQDLDSPEAVDRFINAFAAGFGVGGPLGAAANLRSNKPENLLNPGQQPEPPVGGALTVIPPPAPPAPGTAVAPYYTPVTPMGVMPQTPGPLGGPPPAALPQLPGPVAPVSPLGGPVMMVTPEGQAYQDQMLRQRANVPPGPQPGSQGVLNVLGGTVSAQELATRMQPPAVGDRRAPMPIPPGMSPQQGALQFAPPAPAPQAPGALGQALRRATQAQQTQQAIAQRAAQQEAQRQADLDRLANVAAAQRQMDLVQPTAPPPMPTRPSGPTQPVQLPLFTRRQAPRPSRAEGLRRGQRLPAPVGETPLTPAQRRAQLVMFTQEGEPSVAALKAAGVKTKAAKPAPKPRATKTPGARGLKKGARVAEVIVMPQRAYVPATAISAVQAIRYGDGTRGGLVTLNNGKIVEVTEAASGVWTAGETPLGATLDEAATAVLSLESTNPLQPARQEVVAAAPKAREQARTFMARREQQLEAEEDIAEQEAPSAAQEGKLKQGRVEQRPQDNAGVRARRDAGQQPSAQVPAGGAPAGGRGVALKRGAQQEEVRPAVAAALKKGELAQAGRQWGQYADPETQPKWSELSDAQKEAWRKVVIDDGKPTIAAAEEIAPPKKETPEPPKAEAAPAAAPALDEDVDLTPAEMLAEEIAAAESATDIATFKEAVATVLNYAFFVGEDTNIKKLVDQARAFLNNTQFTDAQMAAMDEAFLDAAQFIPQLEAVYKSTTKNHKKDDPKPWFSYATSRGLLPSIKAKITNLPAEFRQQTDPVTNETTPEPPKTSAQQANSTPQALLGELIDDLITRVREYAKLDQPALFHGKSYANVVELAKQLYARVDAVGREYIVRGEKLKDYFTADGEPKMLKSGGRYIISTKEVSTAEQRKIEERQRAEAKAMAAEEAELRSAEIERARMEKKGFKEDAWDDPDGMFRRDDGSPLTGTIPVGRVKLLVKSFLDKLRRKPTVHVYANVEDLKQRNPELYARAAAARENGDFDTVNAAGYSFGRSEPDEGVQMSRRQFLRFAGASLGALKLPPLPKNAQLSVLRDAWEATFTAYEQWMEAAAALAKTKAARDTIKQFGVSNPLFERTQSKAVGSFLYNVEYNETYANDGYDYALADLLSKDGVGALADLQQAMQEQRSAILELLKKQTAEKPKDKFPGAHVIIFTDFVRTEQQLKFVLAHETLGHFGFRGVMPSARLNEVLNSIYDRDADVRAAVDAMVSTRGMSKLEAIEEYLADNAATLDASLITRIWTALKNFLNRLGFQFQDDEARYLVGLARKYVRRGDTGNFVNARTLVAGLEAVEADSLDGRYARVESGNMGSRVFAAGALNSVAGNSKGLLGAIDAFAKDMFGKGRDVPGTIARLSEYLQTLDNKARRSYGLSLIYRLLERQQQFARALLSKYQRMTQFTHSPSIFGYGDGVTEAQKQVAGELLARAALLRAKQVTDDVIQSYDSLVNIDAAGNVTVNTAVRDRLERAGMVTAEEFRKGFEVEYTDGSKVRFQYDVDENSPEWRVYTEMRGAVNESAIDLLLANYEAAQSETRRVIGDLNIGRRATNVFTADDLAAIRRAAEIYRDRRYEGSDVANAGVETRDRAERESEKFVIAFGRALFNDDVYAAWMKDPAAKPKIVADLQEFQNAEFDDIRAQLASLRAKLTGSEEARKQQSFDIQKAIRDIFFFDLQSRNADFYAKRTILGSYVPFTRRGSEQVRLAAYDARGNPVELDENIRAALPYFQVDSRSEAQEIAKELDEQFGGDNDFILRDAKGNETTVKLRAEISRTRQTPDLTEAVNFNEFVYVLNRLNVNLAPDVRERIVTTLTNQNARARRNLQRSGTEGWDKDVVRSVSEHLETTAHVAAKKLYRHRLDDVMLNNSNWLGDPERLRLLKQAVDDAPTDGERARAQRAYDEYAFMYRYMRASAGDSTVTIDGKEMPTLGRGEDYREEAKSVLRWYSEATNISDSTEDFLSGEAGSRLKLLTVLMQLGGSVATAAINLMSLATHSLPYLSYYNSKRGFGGGYGTAKASTALWKAMSDVKNFRLSDDAFLEEVLRDGSYGRYGLTEDEAQFLFDQTEKGLLQAAQFNALVGTARGKVFSNKAQAAVRAWMSAFSYTEQLNRRATALAAYRLEKDRLQSQGITDQQQLIDLATEAASKAVTSSQGEYAMFNRPGMARGNVLQYIFMYKQFVITTVQLLRGMPVKGQLLMLGFLLLASGLKGLPFAEDIFDLVDTIAQKLGLKTASIEKELYEFFDSVAPGAAPVIMRGGLDGFIGATFSTRLGMGDLLPLTGAFKAGADPARELADFAGPVFGGISGLVGMAGSVAKYGAETVGLRDDVTSIQGILRDSPIAAVRALADGYTYLDTGMITNTRGQVVSREAPYLTILARTLGFYPAIATQQNDIVRLSKDVASYAKAIKAEYVSAYVKARLSNDTERMQSIVADVRQWNEDAAGTGLAISDFVRSANRAAQEASRPTALRYLKSAPKQMRPETVELLRINGLEDEIR